MENFKINNKLNIKKLRSDFKKNKTVIIENFLDRRSADKLYNFLAFEMPEDWWYTSYCIQSLSGDNMKVIRKLPKNDNKINNLYMHAYKDFGEELFTYIFDRSINHAENCNCLECEYKEFLKSDNFKKFIKDITKIDMSMSGEVFCSRYTSGQFLSPHHDIDKGTINFVYSLSKNWKPQYGGNLYLLEDDWRTIKKVVLSSYNRLALTLMNLPEENRIGIPHFVSPVSIGVKKPRLSITGWVS
jgi:Rps23 Pro-64 3,4-dihydroxylase Tpa1-like proline 4-hydroxylase